MADEDSSAISPPYISFRTFLNLIERLEEGGIPQHIDRSYWKGFLSGSLGPQVMGALRFFNLITGTDNEPTPDLERLVEDKEHRKLVFAEMLREYYASVFNDVDLARATTGHLEKTFTKHFKLSAETRRKAITFFLHAVQYAEFPLSSFLRDASRTRSTVTRSSSRSAQKRSQQNGSPSPAHEVPASKRASVPFKSPSDLFDPKDTKTITLRSGGEVTLICTIEWMSIDQEDRTFVFDLIDRLRKYEHIGSNGDVNDEGEEEEAEL